MMNRTMVMATSMVVVDEVMMAVGYIQDRFAGLWTVWLMDIYYTWTYSG